MQFSSVQLYTKTEEDGRSVDNDHRFWVLFLKVFWVLFKKFFMEILPWTKHACLAHVLN